MITGPKLNEQQAIGAVGLASIATGIAALTCGRRSVFDVGMLAFGMVWLAFPVLAWARERKYA
jgi:hypothetical protein